MENEEKILELARKHGYNNLFAHKDNFEELMEYFQTHSKEERYIAILAIMMTINTLAVMRAKKEVKDVA